MIEKFDMPLKTQSFQIVVENPNEEVLWVRVTEESMSVEGGGIPFKPVRARGQK